MPPLPNQPAHPWLQAVRSHPIVWGMALLGGFMMLTVTAAVLSNGSFRNGPVRSSSTDIVVDTSGIAWQGSDRVGALVPLGDALDLRLDIVPVRTVGSFSLLVRLPKPAGPLPQVSLSSLQGTSTFAASSVDPQTVSLMLDSVLADSHTVAHIRLTSDYVQLPLLTQVYGWLTARSTQAWIWFSVLILLATYFYLRRLTSFKVPSGTEQDTVPDRLNPLQAGMLLKGQFGATELSALVYDLAQRGCLEIIEKGGDVYFARKNAYLSLAVYEQRLLDMLSPRNQTLRSLSDIEAELQGELFSQSVTRTYVELYHDLAVKNYFTKNLRDLHLYFKTLGIVFQFAALAVIVLGYIAMQLSYPGIIAFGIACYAIGFLLYRSGYSIRPYTQKGAACASQLLGFSKYLSDQNRLDPDSSHGDLFYRYLPFAIVFSYVASWHSRFTGTTFYVPTWYSNADAEAYDPVHFLNLVTSVTERFAILFTSAKDPDAD